MSEGLDCVGCKQCEVSNAQDNIKKMAMPCQFPIAKTVSFCHQIIEYENDKDCSSPKICNQQFNSLNLDKTTIKCTARISYLKKDTFKQ